MTARKTRILSGNQQSPAALPRVPCPARPRASRCSLLRWVVVTVASQIPLGIVARAAGEQPVSAVAPAPSLPASTPASTPAPAPVDPQKFPATLKHADRGYTLVGTGLRVEATTRSYAMGLYVQDLGKPSFRAVYDRAGGNRAGLYIENRAHNFFIWGHFAKLGILRFLRPLPKEDLQRMFSDGLADLLTEKSPLEVRQAVLSFLALLDTDVLPGQELRLGTDDRGQVDLYLDGKHKPGPQNPVLARHVWEIWLGFHPAQKDMRQTLLDKLDALKR